MQLAATPDLAVSTTSLPQTQRMKHLPKFLSPGSDQIELGSDWNIRHS